MGCFEIEFFLDILEGFQKGVSLYIESCCFRRYSNVYSLDQGRKRIAG